MRIWLKHMRPFAMLLGLAMLGVTVLGGCTVDEETEPTAPATTLDERACPPQSVASWEDFGAPFMYGWCNGCHGAALPAGERQDAPLDMNFDELSDTRMWADRIWARAADHNVGMPPVGGPELEERTLLGDWLACGALERSDYQGEN